MQVLISSKYQIVIPKVIRNKLRLRKGERMHIRVKGGSVILVPDKPIQSFRGVLKGTRLDDIREEGERL